MDANSWTSACLRGRVDVCLDAFLDECVFAWACACLRGRFLGRVRVFLSEFFFLWTRAWLLSCFSFFYKFPAPAQAHQISALYDFPFLSLSCSDRSCL